MGGPRRPVSDLRSAPVPPVAADDHIRGPEHAPLVIVGPDATVKWSYQAESPAELPGANLIFDGLSAA